MLVFEIVCEFGPIEFVLLLKINPSHTDTCLQGAVSPEFTSRCGFHVYFRKCYVNLHNRP